MRVRILSLCFGVFGIFAATSAMANVEVSPKPMVRPGKEIVVKAQVSTSNQGFERWINTFRARATDRGITGATFDAAFNGVKYNTDVIQKDRNQSEFTKQIWEYLDSAASDSRVSNGKVALRQNQKILSEVEARYGVEAEVVAAIWGLESAYGTFRGSIPVIEALATLAYDGRRGSFFESQLIAALQIVQSGDVPPDRMTGSWAGAMGHTQFIPTSYLSYAQDFRGDGKRDIWSDDPTDALASTAAYLAKFGWKKGQPWGMEVRLPSSFDFALAGERVKKPVGDWMAMGVRDINGQTIPEHGRSSILLPAGARGAAFVIFDNFHVIERYNTADAYVIGVGHLADRIGGGKEIQAGWPREDRALSNSEKKEMQELLANKGFDPGGADGIMGPNTIAAIRGFQHASGMIADGYGSLDILKLLRK